ncbi:MAG TPA: [Fe-Fe] hydrogenase large subunit C-terminal domain-containing protein [Bacteroidales bacterium]|nr:[Fe-Fe] hydrogenase large subunit C-terminal domain-containing protein [Bacteroidales bacterium]
MKVNKDNNALYHALSVDDALCTGCTHCMTSCPTSAIRIAGGKAVISDKKCVDCGECYKVCPASAITVRQDDIEMIFKFPVRVILIPSVLIGQFSHKIPLSFIYKALRETGFTHVYHVENSVDLVLGSYSEYASTTATRPLISSFCPAIVRLIQVKYPVLIDNIIKVNPPIDMTALYYRNKLVSSGIKSSDIGIFYATPCASKIAAIKSPVGGNSSTVDGVINMNFLFNKIWKNLQSVTDKDKMPITDNLLTSRGILWSLTRGEASHSKKRALAVDGMKNVTEILETIEYENLSGVDFLELRACDEGCTGGVLMSGNRFLNVERLLKLASDYAMRPCDRPQQPDDNFSSLKSQSYLGDIEPRSIDKLDEEISVAMKKMERKQEITTMLPGFDCGACGAPDCQTLSEDIVQEKEKISACVFIRQQMVADGSLEPADALEISERVWGLYTDRNKTSTDKSRQ